MSSDSTWSIFYVLDFFIKFTSINFSDTPLIFSDSHHCENVLYVASYIFLDFDGSELDTTSYTDSSTSSGVESSESLSIKFRG